MRFARLTEPARWKFLKKIPQKVLISVIVLVLALSSLIFYHGRTHAQTDTFTTSGNWTVPAGVSTAVFEAWGGGGGGGGSTSSGFGGGGGAGGQYAKTTFSVNSGDSYTITVATATGTTTATGATGGDSSVTSPSSVTVTLAKGGAGGVGNNGGGGAGSTTGGVGDVVFRGGNGGGGGSSCAVGGGGGGGAGSTGAGGDSTPATGTGGAGTSTNGGNGGNGSGNANAAGGNNYGGGGGGPCKTNGSAKSGGAGAQGLVTVTYSFNSAPGTPTISTPASGSIVASTTPSLQMSSTDPDGDAVEYSIFIYNTSSNDGTNCTGSSFESQDQTAGQGGWSQSAAYTSGATATYTVQSSMTRGNSYCWQVKAIDPSGSNTFSSLTKYSVFTINSAPTTPSLSAPASGATGVSTTPAFTLSSTDSDANWSQTGSSLGISSATSPSLAVLSSTRVAYFDSLNSQLRTYDFNGSTWSQTGSSLTITSAGIPALAALSSSRVAFVGAGTAQLQTYDFSGSTWSQTGSSLSITSSGSPALAAMSGTRVAFIDSTNRQLRAYDFSGSTWSQTGSSLSITSTGLPALTSMSSSRVAFIDDTNQQLRAYDFSGSTWSQTGSSLSIPSTFGAPALADISSSRVAYIDSSNQMLQTYDFNGSTWSQTGSSLSISGMSDPALASLSSSQLAFIDDSNQQLRTYTDVSDYLQYRIYLYQSNCSTAVSGSPFDMSGAGWSGQDANGGTAYASGTTATYTYQSTLSTSTTYCWKADATDPGGSNTYSSPSATQLFTTTGPTTPTNIHGNINIHGNTTIN